MYRIIDLFLTHPLCVFEKKVSGAHLRSDCVSECIHNVVDEHMIELSLLLPDEHTDCAAWLRSLPPEVLGPVLEVARSVNRLPRGDDASHAQEVAHLRSTHLKHLADLRAHVEAEYEMRARAKMDAQKGTHAAEQERLAAMVVRAEEALAAARVERDKLRASAADVEATVKSEYEIQLARLQGLLNDVQTKSDMSTKLVVDQMRNMYEQQLVHMRMEQAQREQEQYVKLDSVVAAFGAGGNSSDKGRAGENLVRHVHERLERGTLEDCTHVKAAGFADYTWDWTPPDCARITCLVEIKNSRSCDKSRDLNKFALDVREGSQTQRINAAMFISLVDRVAGKPRVSIELVHGVPTLWASRQPDDDISPSALVELAFVTFAGCWPLLAVNESRNDITSHAMLQAVASCLKSQVGEFQRLQPRIDSMQDAADRILREVTHMRRIRDDLMQGARAMQLKLPGVSADEEVENLVAHLEKAVRDYRAAHRERYPKELADLKDLLPYDVFRCASDDAFQTAGKRVRTESQKMRVHKRKLNSE